ncbi:MAG: DNA polymerase III subunit beta [Alphaproteobacteria bacterium]
MKLSIERAALLSALGHVQGVVERRNTIPILSNVLLEAKDGRLALSATDMDIAVTEHTSAQVGQGGTTTASAHTLHDIARKLPEGAEVELATGEGGGRLAIRSGRSRFQLSCLPPEDFPLMSAGELPHRFVLAAAELRGLVERTRFAISTEETRYYLNGIYFHAAKSGRLKVLRAVATDGHRLARVEMPLPEGADGMPGVIVPRKTVTELRRLIEDSTDPVEVALSDTRVSFAFGHVVLVSKLIDGTFPDYERVIPTENNKIMEVEPKRFAAAVDRVATISTEKSRAIKFSLKDGTLTLSATSPDSGTASEEVEVGYKGDAIEIGFNSRYLLDITERMEGEGIQFCMSDAASPTLVRDRSDASALYVLMPMRV